MGAQGELPVATEIRGVAEGVRQQRDGLPEQSEYRDDGCGRGCERSLECPFARCRWDDPMRRRREERDARDQEVVRIRATEGLTINALATQFTISRRTVHRILAEARMSGTQKAAAGTSETT